jgi:hypothetical protein
VLKVVRRAWAFFIKTIYRSTMKDETRISSLGAKHEKIKIKSPLNNESIQKSKTKLMYEK